MMGFMFLRELVVSRTAEINVCCLSYLVCAIFLEQPELIQAVISKAAYSNFTHYIIHYFSHLFKYPTHLLCVHFMSDMDSMH